MSVRPTPCGSVHGHHQAGLTRSGSSVARTGTFSADWGGRRVAGDLRPPEIFRRLRSEKPRRGTGGRGFDSRHLQERSGATVSVVGGVADATSPAPVLVGAITENRF